MSVKDILFSAWKKDDQYMDIIKLQNKFILLFSVMCILFFIGWITAPSRMTVYIPPDISNGATIKAGQIPKPLVYSFAYEIWQEINYWPQDGEKDYKNNIHAYGAYLTPNFNAELLQDNEDLKVSGQVQRQRFMQGVEGAAFDETNIKKLSNNTWEINLKMRLTEYKNNQPVKDVEILYPVKVVRANISSQNNPYGLQLAGFVSDPVRLKTYI